jgi:hypothetical protein
VIRKKKEKKKDLNVDFGKKNSSSWKMNKNY